MVYNLTQSFINDQQSEQAYDFLLENPVGLLRHRPFMQRDPWLAVVKLETVDYCAYTHPFQKSTDVWHSTAWTPKGSTGDGRCHQRCGSGRVKSNGKYAHWKTHAQTNSRGVQGSSRMIQKWQLPKALTEEFVGELQQIEGKKYVIDLFSGGESWREATEKAGYTYIPVDIQKLGELCKRQSNEFVYSKKAESPPTQSQSQSQ